MLENECKASGVMITSFFPTYIRTRIFYQKVLFDDDSDITLKMPKAPPPINIV